MSPFRPALPPAMRPRSTRRRSRPTIVAALGLALLGAGTAQAATVDHSGGPAGTLTVTGTAAAEHVLLSLGGNGNDDPSLVQLSVDGGVLTPAAIAAGCVVNDPASDWVCPRPAKVVVQLDAGDDSLSVYEATGAPFTVPIEADGGPGADVLDGASGNDVLHGGDGDDALTGRSGDDRLYGQNGNDTLNGDATDDSPGGNDLLDGGAGDDAFEQYVGIGYPASLQGDDTYVGGPGNDSFSYFHRSDAVNISLDGVANDGKAGEADNIHPDIETVGGSAGNDVIGGSPGNDHLWGGDGDDRISGLAGNDRLSGDGGDDTVDGGPGNDELSGGCMSDTIIGGPGADTFYSDAAPFSTCGAMSRSPFDRIEAADGEQDALVFCQEITDQAGDVAVVDAVDPVTNSGPGACGTISVVAAPGGAGGGGTGGSGAGGGSTPAKQPAALKGKRRAKLGKTLELLTGTGKKGQAAKQRVDRKRKRLTLGTLRATMKTKVTTTATIRRKGRTVTLGRLTVTVEAGTTRTLTVKLTGKAVRALKGVKKARVATSFKVGKKTYRKTFRITVAGSS